MLLLVVAQEMTVKILFSFLVLIAAGSGFVHAAPGDDYPSKPIRIIVTAPPGGAADFIARVVGAKLAQVMGSPVVVENRAGASGTIAAAYVAQSQPDGYTLLQSNNATHGSGPYVFPKLPYDTFKDFAPVSLLAILPMIMTVSATLPVNTVEEFIAMAKARPGQMSFASAGNGSTPHFAGELLKIAADIDMLHIPYKGSGPAVVDVASGRVQVMFDAAPSLLPHIQSGKLRPLASASAKRNSLVPNTPTFTERDIRGMDIALWYGVHAPAATPPVVIGRLNAALRKVLEAPDVLQRFAESGTIASPNTPEEFAAFIRDDYQRWGSVIKRAGLKFD